MPPKVSNTIQRYYDTLNDIHSHNVRSEGATRIAFQNLLTEWGKQPKYDVTVLAEQEIEGTRKRKVRPDALVVDRLMRVPRGLWEAKDTKDDLRVEIQKKIEKGYPLYNIVFEDTRVAVLYQEGKPVLEADMTKPAELERLLSQFLGYRPPQIEEFHTALKRFRADVPGLANALTILIDSAKKANKDFRAALDAFLKLCQESLNPATTIEQVEDMLKQHILTERIFSSIFQNRDFVRRNDVAQKLEAMVAALTNTSFSREVFLKSLDYFYNPIEEAARTISDYGEKQALLNTLYEQFFQAYSIKSADTHGIVYTPREIVAWMVGSVQQALEREFGLGLASPNVHIIDPAVGTGTFIMELMQRIKDTDALQAKYAGELHANEVLLLPYYIAAQNIEHAYYERTGSYAPFTGLCFADTLDLADSPQMSLFAEQNSQRIAAQKAAPIRVIIGNPPYNVGQENENDNNKNRPHKTVDDSLAATYVKDSRATLRRQLYDPYVKFFRWATNRLGERDGIVCYVSNNSFLEQIAFDGMRKHLMQDFTRIYTFDMGGNIRKNPKLSGTTHNVFGIQVGVAITLLVRNSQHTTHELYYARVGEDWTKEQKYKELNHTKDYTTIEWQHLTPDARNTWLTEGMNADFDTYVPMGTKEAKAEKGLEANSIFKTYSMGVSTNRDTWAYDFDQHSLATRTKAFIETYNEQVFKWTRLATPKADVDQFVLNDDKRIKWSRNLKRDLQRSQYTDFSGRGIRKSLYRPYNRKLLYFADHIIDERGTNGTYFPNAVAEQENSAICVSAATSNKPFHALTTSAIPDLHLTGDTQCFPFYVYAEDGSNRRENITDWALGKFRDEYADPTITKWDIFHYVYAVLHAPGYRAAYAENLKRDLPRIPFVQAADFRAYVAAGERLARLHRGLRERRGVCAWAARNRRDRLAG